MTLKELRLSRQRLKGETRRQEAQRIIRRRAKIKARRIARVLAYAVNARILLAAAEKEKLTCA